jgi:hypothetical protein
LVAADEADNLLVAVEVVFAKHFASTNATTELGELVREINDGIG